MNQQPDKLFRDKLQSYQTPAPSGAWNRIEANLDKKNNKVLWLRIAASLLLLAVAAYLLWPSDSIITPSTPLADQTKTEKPSTTTKPEIKTEEQIVKSTPVPQNVIAKKQTNLSNRTTKKQRVQEKIEAPIAEKEQVQLAENNMNVVEQELSQNEESIISPAQSETAVVASAETQKVKIIFSADEVNNKYLDKKSLAEATSEDKKSSTLKKLLDKAYDLKYNQDPFGDLRQKKNEILALNFRTDKQRK